MNKVRYYKICDCGQRSDSALKTWETAVIHNICNVQNNQAENDLEKCRLEKLESPQLIARIQQACG